MTKEPRPSYLNFDKNNYPWQQGIDYRQNSELYRVGKGEQGVLICEPYKSEIGIHWRFKTPEIAQQSSQSILGLFNSYLIAGDFVGADMARKYLQMGFTRARRYANYKGGKKYDENDNYRPLQKGTGERLKAESANIFYHAWQQVEANEQYQQLKRDWKARYG